MEYLAVLAGIGLLTLVAALAVALGYLKRKGVDVDGDLKGLKETAEQGADTLDGVADATESIVDSSERLSQIGKRDRRTDKH